MKRIRTVDSYTRLWWIAKSDFPKADNSKVLRPYSDRMKYLLSTGRYNAGKRPSQHKIGEKSFLKDCGGLIAHNLFELDQMDSEREVRLPKNAFSFSNSISSDFLLRTCKERGIVRIQVFDWGIREGMKKSQQWADRASRKKAIALLP